MSRKITHKLLGGNPNTIVLPWGPSNQADSFGWATHRTQMQIKDMLLHIGSGICIPENQMDLWMDEIDEIAPDLVWDAGFGYSCVTTEKEMEWLRRHCRVVVVNNEGWAGGKHKKPSLLKDLIHYGNAAKKIVNETLHPVEWHIYKRGQQFDAGLRGTLRLQLPTKLLMTDLSFVNERLHKFFRVTPEAAVIDAECRACVEELLKHEGVRIEPDCREQLVKAVEDAKAVAIPIMPPTEFERIAYCEEEAKLRCMATWGPFKKGQSYPVTTKTYSFKQKYIRKKAVYNEQTGQSSLEEHDCQLQGEDRKVRVFYGTNQQEDYVDFMHQPDENKPNELPEVNLWGIFAKPVVRTVLESFPDRIQKIEQELNALEWIADMSYYVGQRDYLKRVLCKDHALIAAQTGTGKSLMTITTYCVKDAKRCLIVCPKGTVNSESIDEDTLAQWVSEVHKFAPHIPVFTIFNEMDYHHIRNLNGGKLPEGIYLTYYEAMFQNGGIESCPRGKKDLWLYGLAGATPPEGTTDETNHDAHTVGHERDGIRCIVKPCLSTVIGDQFDMVCLDEAHKLQNLSSNRTQMAVRMPAKYRYAFTATPVPNNATDLFAIMGWLCVPAWYKGGVCNAAFPFRKEDESQFVRQFLTKERDLTKELKFLATEGKKKKTFSKSPVLSAPARLLKMLKPTIAYITKAKCNPDYVPPHIVDIRVPLGTQQAALYNWYTNPGNITAVNSLARFGAQVNALRATCTDPKNSQYNGKEGAPTVESNFNPKLVAILEIIRDRLAEGEQVVVVNARTGLNHELMVRLQSCGVRVSRIDSTRYSGNHAQEAQRFKQGKSDVMLMGLRCAVGHSFDQCKHLIVGSIDYSPGPFEQAIGRVDRIASTGAVIYCILNAGTIEELQFDTTAMKDDASKIILRGERVPRDFKPTDMSEVLVESLINWKGATPETMDESACESKWLNLAEQITEAVLLAS